MKTIVQVADWIMQHRKGKAFQDYSYEKVLDELCVCSEADSMLCVIDSTDNIVGVVCGSVDQFKKVFHTYDVLTIQKNVFKEMIKQFKIKYPGFSIQGTRKNGKLIAYNNIDRMLKLTTAYGK